MLSAERPEKYQSILLIGGSIYAEAAAQSRLGGDSHRFPLEPPLFCFVLSLLLLLFGCWAAAFFMLVPGARWFYFGVRCACGRKAHPTDYLIFSTIGKGVAYEAKEKPPVLFSSGGRSVSKEAKAEHKPRSTAGG